MAPGDLAAGQAPDRLTPQVTLALWVRALSARRFGYHRLGLLVAQVLMGIANVALTYDVVRRRFGRSLEQDRRQPRAGGLGCRRRHAL